MPTSSGAGKTVLIDVVGLILVMVVVRVVCHAMGV